MLILPPHVETDVMQDNLPTEISTILVAGLDPKMEIIAISQAKFRAEMKGYLQVEIEEIESLLRSNHDLSH